MIMRIENDTCAAHAQCPYVWYYQHLPWDFNASMNVMNECTAMYVIQSYLQTWAEFLCKYVLCILRYLYYLICWNCSISLLKKHVNIFDSQYILTYILHNLSLINVTHLMNNHSIIYTCGEIKFIPFKITQE